MIPKVEACLACLEGGVRKIHIIDGRLRHSLLLEIFTEPESEPKSRPRKTATLSPPGTTSRPGSLTSRAEFRSLATTPPSNSSNSFPGAPELPQAHALHHGSQATIAQFEQFVIPNYRRFPISLVRGEGSWVWDAEGNRYLDFFPGWGCNLLGHCPPRVVDAVRDQVGRLIHVPNTWYMEPQGAFRPGPVRAVIRRAVLLLQQWRRGQRGSHQAGPGVRPCPGPVQDRHDGRGLPWPDLRCA